MDEHIEELFEQVPDFDAIDVFLEPEFFRCVKIIFDIENKMEKWYGEEASELLVEYLVAQVELFEFAYRYYFHQGYLAAQAEFQKNQEI